MNKVKEIVEKKSSINFGLQGKRVVIIGAQRGIGYELAKAFQAQGANLVITSESEDIFKAKDMLLENNENETIVEAVQCDVTNLEQIQKAFEEIGKHDILIANAGMYTTTLSTNLSEQNVETFQRHFDINVIGLRNCAVAAVPYLEPGSRIIFTGSIWGKVGASEYSAYVASKHAVLGLMKSMAMDLGPLGISVNAVNPGSIATQANISELSEEKKASLTAQMSLRKGLIDPKHLVGAYLFLASDAASEIHGESITVDRGQTI